MGGFTTNTPDVDTRNYNRPMLLNLYRGGTANLNNQTTANNAPRQPGVFIFREVTGTGFPGGPANPTSGSLLTISGFADRFGSQMVISPTGLWWRWNGPSVGTWAQASTVGHTHDSLNLSGTLTVAGVTTLNGATTIRNNFSVTGTATLNPIVTFQGENINGNRAVTLNIFGNSNTTANTANTGSAIVTIRGTGRSSAADGVATLIIRNNAAAGSGGTLQVGGGTANNTTTISAGAITTVTLTTQSDRRLKTKIRPANFCNSVLDLEVVEFVWKSSKQNSFGVIAQEVQKVYPQIVTINEKTKMLSVEEYKLVYPLLIEVKKLRHEVDELKRQVL